jgi:hypothetical protein
MFLPGIQKSGLDTGFAGMTDWHFIGKPASRFLKGFRTPAGAGVTIRETFRASSEIRRMPAE